MSFTIRAKQHLLPILSRNQARLAHSLVKPPTPPANPEQRQSELEPNIGGEHGYGVTSNGIKYPLYPVPKFGTLSLEEQKKLTPVQYARYCGYDTEADGYNPEISFWRYCGITFFVGSIFYNLD